MLNEIVCDTIIKEALKEDMPFGDITTDSIIDENSQSEAILMAKEDGVIAGLDVARRVFELVDGKTVFIKIVKEGSEVKKGDIIAKVQGRTSSLLKSERVSLNFLQHLSGIATKTHRLVSLVKDLPVSISDTRKTLPGLRMLEKYAVKVGGGSNHRFSLSDGVLIKDNHIKAAGSITGAVEAARKNVPHTTKIEVETEDLEQVTEAVGAGADIIMLDNMDVLQMKKAVEYVEKRALTEASGNINEGNIREKALSGVDIISVGALTHSAQAFDISMKFR